MPPKVLCESCKINYLSPEKAKAPNAQFCDSCSVTRRVMHLELNNLKWKLRQATGEAGHRIMYDGKVTAWAKKNPVQAVKEAVKEGYTDEQLQVLLENL